MINYVLIGRVRATTVVIVNDYVLGLWFNCVDLRIPGNLDQVKYTTLYRYEPWWYGDTVSSLCSHCLRTAVVLKSNVKLFFT
jgi:hypothetical protein